MPEGPTVHRLALDHAAMFAGQKLHMSSPQGRFDNGAAALDKKMLQSVDACGKHLFYHFAGKKILHIHLGLYGKFRLHDNPPPTPRGAVRVRMQGKTQTIDLNGPTACEVIAESEAAEIFARLGPDPLRLDAKPAAAWERIHRSPTPIGLLLMDQSVIAGLGNIYRCELLWLYKIHPRTPGNTVSKAQFNALWRSSKQLMKLAVDKGSILTNEKQKWAKRKGRLMREDRFNIYKVPTCPRCHGSISRFVMGGRNVFACETCQVL